MSEQRIRWGILSTANIGKVAVNPAIKASRNGTLLAIASREVQRARDFAEQLAIERPAIAAYLEHIAPDKLEIALVHALEVGVTELAARRERFKK